jgi:hypothetical protein
MDYVHLQYPALSTESAVFAIDDLSNRADNKSLFDVSVSTVQQIGHGRIEITNTASMISPGKSSFV